MVRLPLLKATNMRTQQSRLAGWAQATLRRWIASSGIAAWTIRPSSGKGAPAVGTIERLDSRLDQIVPRDAQVERIAEGFDWSEGPVWDQDGRFLLFSDVPRTRSSSGRKARGQRLPQAERLHRHAARGRRAGLQRPVDRRSQGRLVLCQHGDRRVARLDADGTFIDAGRPLPGQAVQQPQ